MSIDEARQRSNSMIETPVIIRDAKGEFAGRQLEDFGIILRWLARVDAYDPAVIVTKARYECALFRIS